MTDDLVELSRQLQERVSQLADVKSHRERIDRVRSMTERTSNARDRLKSQLDLVTEMAKDENLKPTEVPRSRAEALKRLVDTVLDDLVTAVDDDEIAKVVDHLQGLSQELRAIIERRWTAVSTQVHLQDIKGLLLALLRVEGYAARAGEMMALVRSIDSTLESGVVSGSAHYRLFRRDLQQLLDAVDALEISDKPGLEEFLKDAAAERASLARLTPAIRSWIEDEGLLEYFLIRPGRTSG
jgi:hypothetical protein